MPTKKAGTKKAATKKAATKKTATKQPVVVKVTAAQQRARDEYLLASGYRPDPERVEQIIAQWV